MTGSDSLKGRQVPGVADVEGVPGSRSSKRVHAVETGMENGNGADDDLIKVDEDATEGGDEGSQLPDGGWGWMIALGSFIITMLIPMVVPCFGVIFSRYLLLKGASSTTTAWIFNTQCLTWNMMGLLVRPLAKEFSWRRVAIVGVLLASSSVIISAFSPSPEFLFFSFSLLSGVGGGLVVCMCFILVPMYFERRRGMANAVMMSGVCMGQIVGPPFVRYLQDEYGFRGATLIIGAMMLNGLVGAALFHPVEWHMKQPRPNEKMQGDGAPGESEEGRAWLENSLSGEDKGESKSSRGPLINASEASKKRVGGEGSQQRRRSLVTLLVHVARSTISDLGIFRSPRAVIISFGCALFLNGYYNFVMMVPFAMQEAGHTLQDSAWCISVSAACNLLARISMSSLSDWQRFNMRGAYMAGIAATAASIFVPCYRLRVALTLLVPAVFPLLHDVPWLLAAMAVWGSGVGTTMGLYNLVMVRFMGLDNLAPVFAASSLTNAFGFLCVGPLIGVIRDMSDSYAVSMWVLSGIVFTSFILWLFMPAAQAYDQRRRAKESERECL